MHLSEQARLGSQKRLADDATLQYQPGIPYAASPGELMRLLASKSTSNVQRAFAPHRLQMASPSSRIISARLAQPTSSVSGSSAEKRVFRVIRRSCGRAFFPLRSGPCRGLADRLVPRRCDQPERRAKLRVVDDVRLLPLVSHLRELAHHRIENAHRPKDEIRNLNRLDRTTERA